MFDERLKVLLIVFGVSLAAIVVRLGQLQIVQASYYRERAERSVLSRPKSLPFVRGSILDRTGKVLVRDEPSWDLAIDYEVIAADAQRDPDVLSRLAQRWQRAGYLPETESEAERVESFVAALDLMWRDIAAFAGDAELTVADLRDVAAGTYEKVSTIREAVARRRGFDAPVAEETRPHPILTELNDQQQVAARELFSRFPCVHVEPASVRRFSDGAAAFAHVIGRTGRVRAEDITNDPHADDAFASYRGDETRGISGVEWLAEQTLRGRRGQLTLDRDDHIVAEGYIVPQNGDDVRLTIHADLQQRLHRLIRDAVAGVRASSGGAIVVLDVATREVLALVSYPAYDPNHFDELYPELRDDTERLPLWFRAVASRYAPGSTIKPLVCLAGLMNQAITLDTRLECTGYLFEDHRDRWRCWQVHGTDTRKAHGSIDVVHALTGSCNVFMYKLGERLGVDRLCNAFDMVGVGRTSGLGLREEDTGINPTPSWLMVSKNIRATPGTARLFAIGQGELSMTPVQVANLMATYASGAFRELRLIHDEPPGPKWTIPVTSAHWLAIRRGMFGVVNDPEGTAYKHAHFVHDRYALVGKTGSATAYPWPTSYRVPYVDADGAEHFALIRAGARGPAIDRFEREHPDAVYDPDGVESASHWPPVPPEDGERHSHAWFGGFLQRIGPDGTPEWSETPKVAFAVLVEFGGSGGRTSGPLAKDVASTLLDVLGPELEVP